MRDLLKAFIFIIFLFGCSCSNELDTIPEEKDRDYLAEADSYKQKAISQFKLIVDKYAIPGSHFYNENYPKKANDKYVAYLWTLSTLFNAANNLVFIGFEQGRYELESISTALDSYWDDDSDPGGFASYPPALGGGTRFYDDNASIGLDFIEAYEVSLNSDYLEKAKKAYEFAISGEDSLCGGGIYWNELERSPGYTYYIKAANTTGFTACLALKLYAHTQNEKYLQDAKRLYKWNKENMQDPVDKTYYNHIDITTKIKNKTKWSYNSGIMLSNAALLYSATNDKQYLNDANELADAIYNYFTTASSKVRRALPNNTPWFQAIVLRAYSDYYKIDARKENKYIDVFIENINYAWENSRDDTGFFYEDWIGEKEGRIEMLLTQACIVEMYARIYDYIKNNKEI